VERGRRAGRRELKPGALSRVSTNTFLFLVEIPKSADGSVVRVTKDVLARIAENFVSAKHPEQSAG